MVEPKELNVGTKKEGYKISLTWSDGHRATYTPFNLRSACPCAMCQGEGGLFGKYYSPEKLNIRQDIEPEEIEPVGRYGLKISWSDGHNLGIYTFQYLRGLCECEECQRNRSSKVDVT
jgi:DUF971 family protein